MRWCFYCVVILAALTSTQPVLAASCPIVEIVVEGTLWKGAKVAALYHPDDLTSNDKPSTSLFFSLNRDAQPVTLTFERGEGSVWLIAARVPGEPFAKRLGTVAFDQNSVQSNDVQFAITPPIGTSDSPPSYLITVSNLRLVDGAASLKTKQSRMVEGDCQVAADPSRVTRHLYPPGVGDELMRSLK